MEITLCNRIFESQTKNNIQTIKIHIYKCVKYSLEFVFTYSGSIYYTYTNTAPYQQNIQR